MPYTTSPQELREAFVQLPDNVRKWLASEKVLAVVTDMNDRLEYFGDKVSVIPWLITRLAVKDIAPKYFMSELRDYLVVDENEARAITEEIDKRILRPIEPALNRLDIDLNSLYLGQAAPVGLERSGDRGRVTEGGTAVPSIGAREQFGIVAESEAVTLRQAQGIIKNEAQDINKQSAAPMPPSFAPPSQNASDGRSKAPAGEEGPVMLHTEKEEISQIAREKPGETPSMARPSFSISIPQSKYKKPAAPPPVTVRIETPTQETNKARRQENTVAEPPKIMKVVHYSPFYTRLRNDKD